MSRCREKTQKQTKTNREEEALRYVFEKHLHPLSNLEHLEHLEIDLHVFLNLIKSTFYGMIS